MAATVYILCAATSILCALLLWRGYRRTRARLLLWSCLCFLFLSLNNILLFVDRVVFPETELMIGIVSFPVLRSLTALIGLLLLVFGLIWDSE
jgi:Family of unknown function (DUF5985)